MSLLKVDKVQEEIVRSLCEDLNDLLWNFAPSQWDDAAAARVVGKDVKASAHDSTLNEILAAERGPSSLKALGWMMFGGLEDGAEILPEPILDADIICIPSKNQALLKMRFAAIAPKKIKQWRMKDTREFDGLQAVRGAWGLHILKRRESIH